MNLKKVTVTYEYEDYSDIPSSHATKDLDAEINYEEVLRELLAVVGKYGYSALDSMPN